MRRLRFIDSWEGQCCKAFRTCWKEWCGLGSTDLWGQWCGAFEKNKYIVKKERKHKTNVLSWITLIGAQHLDSLPEFDLSHAGKFSNTELPIALRKGNRSCVTCHPIQNFVSYNHLSHVLHSFISKLSAEQIPTRVSEALCHREWKATIVEEMQALKKNDT